MKFHARVVQFASVKRVITGMFWEINNIYRNVSFMFMIAQKGTPCGFFISWIKINIFIYIYLWPVQSQCMYVYISPWILILCLKRKTLLKCQSNSQHQQHICSHFHICLSWCQHCWISDRGDCNREGKLEEGHPHPRILNQDRGSWSHILKGFWQWKVSWTSMGFVLI